MGCNRRVEIRYLLVLLLMIVNVTILQGICQDYDLEDTNDFSRQTGNDTLEGDILNQIGIFYYSQCQYYIALLYFEESLNLSREIDDRASEGATLNNIGSVYHNLGQYDGALEYYKDALNISRGIGDRSLEGATLNSIGSVYHNLGQYDDALEYYKDALNISREIGDRAREVIILNNIGSIYGNLGRYEDTLKCYEKVLQIQRETGDRAGEGATLNNIGVAYWGVGQYDDALKYCEDSLNISREISDRAGEKTNLNNIGLIYKRLGQYGDALRYYEDSLNISREISDRAGEEAILSNIGLVYNGLGQYDDALKYCEDALNISRDIGDSAGEGTNLNNIGVVYDSLGQYDKALKYYEDALNITRDIGNWASEEALLSNIGLVYNSLGQYDDALKYCEDALLVSRKIGNLAGEATNLNNIGLVYHSLGQYDYALKYHKDALNITRNINYSAGLKGSLNNIGVLYRILGQYEVALKYYEESLNISRDIGDQAGEGVTLNNIGTVYNYLGQYDDALKYYKEALQIRRETGGQKGVGTSLNNIGSVYNNIGRYEEALEYYEDALLIRCEIGDRAGEGITLINIGRAYEDLGEDEKALYNYIEASTRFENVRGELKVEELKTSYAETYAVVYNLIVTKLMTQNRTVEAFNYNERARARTFLDQIGNVRIEPHLDENQDLFEQEESLRHQISALGRSLKDEYSKPEDQRNDQKISNLETRIDQTRLEYSKILARMKLYNPEYASLVTVDPLELEDIQELIPSNTTLLEYYLTKDQTYVFVVNRTDFHVVTLDKTKLEMESLVDELFSDLSSISEFDSSIYIALYDILFAPVKPYVDTDSVIIAPHNVLHYVPYQALYNGDRYLIEDYVISYVPSGSVLRFVLAKHKQNQLVALVFGNPHVPDTPLLLNAETEALLVADLLNVSSHVRDDATETLLISQAPEAGLVHLACHGRFNQKVPLFSRLLLSADDENDGALYVYEIYNLNLSKANLVTLSACQTNLGDLSDGDELIGLTRALIYAGSPAVISSLWSVDDSSASRLMVRFYEYQIEGENEAEALRLAQLELISDQNYRHPRYWAAFCLTGIP